MYSYVDEYTIKNGDTLDSLAKRFNLLTYRQILHVNPDIKNSAVIYPGQVINIPKLVPMSTYVTKPGDTLGTIVYNYNRELMNYYGIQISFDEVLAYNPSIMDPNIILPGMIIYLPEIL
jgi:LysM repeat protein